MAVFLDNRRGGRPGLDEGGSPAGVDQVGEGQSDQHRHQGVEQIEGHHQGAEPAFDVVGDDRAQDREHDQGRGEGGQGAKDHRGQELEPRGAVAPEKAGRNCQQDGEDNPGVQRQAGDPDAAFFVDGGSPLLGRCLDRARSASCSSKTPRREFHRAPCSRAVRPMECGIMPGRGARKRVAARRSLTARLSPRPAAAEPDSECLSRISVRNCRRGGQHGA